MRPHRTLPLLAAIVAVAAVTACGQRQESDAAKPAPEPKRVAPQAGHDVAATFAIGEPAASPETVSVPVVFALDQRAHGFWAVSSDEIANSGTRPKATGGGPWPTVDAGELVMPSRVHPGRINGAAGGEDDDLYLLEIPLAFHGRSGFDKPLTRIDLQLSLGTAATAEASTAKPTAEQQKEQARQRQARAEEVRGWSIMMLRDVGHAGLRYGPPPGKPNDPDRYWFRSDQLLAAMRLNGGAQYAAWRILSTDRRTIPPQKTCYAVLSAPRGSHGGTAEMQARLWFSPGDEATVVLPAQTIAIDFAPPKQR
jgi:hypothetical protein